MNRTCHNLIAILLFAQCFFSPLWAHPRGLKSSGLMLIIHEDKMPAHPRVIKDAIDALDPHLLVGQPPLGEVLSLAPSYKDIFIDEAEFANVWNRTCFKWIQMKADDQYDTIYWVIGPRAQDPKEVQKIFKEALTKHLAVDLFILSKLGSYDFLNIDEDLPKSLRIVGTESDFAAVKFFERFGAKAIFGQKDKKAAFSAPYTFAFLNEWLKGKSFESSMKFSKEAGDQFINNRAGFTFAKYIGGYKNPQEAIESSERFYEGNTGIDLNVINIATCPPKTDACQVEIEPSKAIKAEPKKAEVSWACPRCTLVNDIGAFECSICEHPRP